MSSSTATGEASSSPSRSLFSKTLRKSKGLPGTSRTPSIIDDGSSESQKGLRSSVDAVTSKLKTLKGDPQPADGTTSSAGLKSLLAKAKVKKRRREDAGDDRQLGPGQVQRGRSLSERGRPAPDGHEEPNQFSRSASGDSDSRRSEASRITYDSDEGS